MAIWFSTGAFLSTDLKDILEEASSLNLLNIELSSGTSINHHWIEMVESAITGGQKFLIHNYFPPPPEPFVLNIGSFDEANLDRTKCFARAAIDLSNRINAPFYSIHAGFAATLTPDLLGNPREMAQQLKNGTIDRERSYDVMVKAVRELADYAAQFGLKLLVENNVLSPLLLDTLQQNPLLLTTADEIVQFFSDTDRANVGLLLDVAHAKVSASTLGFSPEGFLSQVSQYVHCVHVSDNDGLVDNNQPANKDSWFIPHLDLFRDCEIVVEAYRLPRETIIQQRTLFEQIFDL